MFPLPAVETRPKRWRGLDGTYLNNSRQSVGGLPTVPWPSLEIFVIKDYCTQININFRVKTRSRDSVFINPGKEDESVINKTSGVVAEAAQLRASVGTLMANDSTLITDKAAVEVLLANEKAKSDELRSDNSVLSAFVDELSGEVRQLTSNATELRTKNVYLMSRVAALQILVISKEGEVCSCD